MTFTIPTGFSDGPARAIPRERRGVAAGLYCLAGSWASDNSHSGYVPAFMIDELGFSQECAESLVDAGIWVRVEAGFRSAEWAARVALGEIRAAAGRAGGLAKARSEAILGPNVAKSWQALAKSCSEPSKTVASSQQTLANENYHDSDIQDVSALAASRGRACARAALDFDFDLDLVVDLALEPSQPPSQKRTSKDCEIADAISGDETSPAAGTDLELSSKSSRHLTLLAEQPNRPDAQALIAEWIVACPVRPPGRVIGHVGREIRQMLREGIPLPTVRAGFIEWHERRLHPSALASVVHQTSLGPPTSAGHRVSRQQTESEYTERVFEEAMARAVARDEARATAALA